VGHPVCCGLGVALGYAVALPADVPEAVPVIERANVGVIDWPTARVGLVFCWVYLDHGKLSFTILTHDEARHAGVWGECSPADGPLPVRPYPAPVAWRLDENP
jgi:hypothetical protein